MKQLKELTDEERCLEKTRRKHKQAKCQKQKILEEKPTLKLFFSYPRNPKAFPFICTVSLVQVILI